MDPVAGQASDVGQHRRTAVADGPCQLDNAARVPLCQPAQGLIEMHHGTAESQDLVPFGVGQVRVAPVALRDRVSESLIKGLLGITRSPARFSLRKVPQRHRDGDTVDGQFADQREHL